MIRAHQEGRTAAGTDLAVLPPDPGQAVDAVSADDPKSDPDEHERDGREQSGDFPLNGQVQAGSELELGGRRLRHYPIFDSIRSTAFPTVST